MKTKNTLFPGFFLLLTGFLLSSCYKEQHFDFPGPYDNLGGNTPDTLPFPFDSTRQAGVWLMKDGVPDYGKILFKGYTDYYPKGDTLSWYQQNDGVHEVPHYNFYPLSNADHFAGDPNAYQFNWVYSKYFVPVGPGKSFYYYAKVTFGTLNATAAGMSLGKSWSTGGNFIYGLDGGSSGQPLFFIDLYGQNGVSINPDLGWPTVAQVIAPGVPAEIEVVIDDGLFYSKINGTLVFKFNLPSQELYFYTPQIRPWRDFLTVHDVYVESSDMYTVDYAMHEYEQGYDRIQAPALAKAANGDLLLFAEGRSHPISAAERVAQNTMPVGDCDIIMKRSTDGGLTWADQLTVLAGEGSPATYCFPQTVSTGDGKIILQYSNIQGSFNGSTYVYDAGSQHVYQRESTDNGLSWSDPAEITSSVTGTNGYVKNGPGHGIELQHAGSYQKRLLMPLAYSSNELKVAISDNGGQTWRLSNAVNGSNLQYGSVVELTDGRLMMLIGHGNTSPRNKLVSYSTDGGENWSAAANISTDVKTGDYGHLFQGVVLQDKDHNIVIVNPTNREADTETKNSPTYPVSPALFRSMDDGVTFHGPESLFTKIAYYGYSASFRSMDAVALEDGTLVIVGEGGVESPKEGIVVYRK